MRDILPRCVFNARVMLAMDDCSRSMLLLSTGKKVRTSLVITQLTSTAVIVSCRCCSSLFVLRFPFYFFFSRIASEATYLLRKLILASINAGLNTPNTNVNGISASFGTVDTDFISLRTVRLLNSRIACIRCLRELTQTFTTQCLFRHAIFTAHAAQCWFAAHIFGFHLHLRIVSI